jgi:crossover junction endodeoxyribonuclease RusA
LAKAAIPPEWRSAHPVSLSVHLEFCPPDKRARDLDNCIASNKAALDGLALATGVDDARWHLSCSWGPVARGGAVVVKVSPRVVNIPLVGQIS